MVADLTADKNARVYAILSNGGYLQSDEGVKARQEELDNINEQFQEMVDQILDPQPEVDLSENPFFERGMSGLDRLRWEMEAQAQVAAQQNGS